MSRLVHYFQQLGKRVTFIQFGGSLLPLSFFTKGNLKILSTLREGPLTQKEKVRFSQPLRWGSWGGGGTATILTAKLQNSAQICEKKGHKNLSNFWRKRKIRKREVLETPISKKVIVD